MKLKHFFKKIYISILRSQQTRAQFLLAEQLRHEYPGHSLHEIVARLHKDGFVSAKKELNKKAENA